MEMLSRRLEEKKARQKPAVLFEEKKAQSFIKQSNQQNIGQGYKKQHSQMLGLKNKLQKTASQDNPQSENLQINESENLSSVNDAVSSTAQTEIVKDNLINDQSD